MITELQSCKTKTGYCLRVGYDGYGTLYTFDYKDYTPTNFRTADGKVFARSYGSMRKKLGIQGESGLAAKFSNCFMSTQLS